MQISKDFISLLPFCDTPKTLFISETLPCYAENIERRPIRYILDSLKKKNWSEGLYAKTCDLDQIKRYKNPDGHYKNDFDENQFRQWVKSIEDNTAICELEQNCWKRCFCSSREKNT